MLLVTACGTTRTTSSVTASRSNDDYRSYIDTYHPIAIEQMKRYRIPASITLAQGLLESAAGKSQLAIKSNNHFGIKADKSWKGKTTSSMDNGRMCKFRSYKAVSESYEDHSKFLVGRERYKSLFQLDITDYEGWAKGLKKAGYAEDAKYPQKLISIIERYELHRYDRMDIKGNTRVVYQTNKVPYIMVENGDKIERIAKELDISKRKLKKYNDIYNDRELEPGERLYLKKKKSKAAKGSQFHTATAGESLYTISQHYCITLKDIFKLNPQYKSYTKLKVGDVIRLR